MSSPSVPQHCPTPRELDEWVPRIEEASAQARRTTVFLNNCYGNYGTTNAVEFEQMLLEMLT